MKTTARIGRTGAAESAGTRWIVTATARPIDQTIELYQHLSYYGPSLTALDAADMLRRELEEALGTEKVAALTFEIDTAGGCYIPTATRWNSI